MLTPQELSDKKFDRVMVWGYDMNAVDSFLETVEADYTTLYKENIALKGKMKVLISKIDEYRKVDESMRKTLLSAQTMADEIIAKARTESADYEERAKANSSRELEELTRRITEEEERLKEAKYAAQVFIDRVLSMYGKEQEFLSALRTREFPGEPIPPASLMSPVKPEAEISESEKDLTEVLSETDTLLPEDMLLPDPLENEEPSISMDELLATLEPPVLEPETPETDSLIPEDSPAVVEEIPENEVSIVAENVEEVKDVIEEAPPASVEDLAAVEEDTPVPSKRAKGNEPLPDIKDAVNELRLDAADAVIAEIASIPTVQETETADDLPEMVEIPEFNMNRSRREKSSPPKSEKSVSKKSGKSASSKTEKTSSGKRHLDLSKLSVGNQPKSEASK